MKTNSKPIIENHRVDKKTPFLSSLRKKNMFALEIHHYLCGFFFLTLEGNFRAFA